MSGPYVEQTGEPATTYACEVCEDTGWVVCWSPGGPCPEGQTACECCGPCRSCERGKPIIAEVAAAEERGAAKERERLGRIYHREPMSQDCRDGSHFGGCTGCRCICHGPNGTRGGWNS